MEYVTLMHNTLRIGLRPKDRYKCSKSHRILQNDFDFLRPNKTYVKDLLPIELDCSFICIIMK